MKRFTAKQSSNDAPLGLYRGLRLARNRARKIKSKHNGHPEQRNHKACSQSSEVRRDSADHPGQSCSSHVTAAENGATGSSRGTSKPHRQ